jgi:hypothetical protein
MRYHALRIAAGIIFFAGTLSAQIVTMDCPALVDSSALPFDTINDYTEHTYSVPFQGYVFVDCQITRKFAKPIQSLKLSIVAGRADDIGYVGSRLVTDTPQACIDVSTVTTSVDVSDQVTLNGDTASVTLRALENCCCRTGWGVLTQFDRANARFHWEVNLGTGGAPYRVRAGIGGSSADADVASSMQTAHFPLGTTFSLQLLKKASDGSYGPVAASSTIESQSVSGSLAGRALFPGRAVFVYTGASSQSTQFQAVHLGSATIRITPADSSQPTVLLPVAIDFPAALGSTHGEFDPSLIAVADEWGLPPQMLKGQVQKESDFVARAYRYEPLSIDFELFSPNGRNWRTIAPFSNFRLRTSDNLSQGTELLAADIDPRGRYNIVRNGLLRRIEPTDELVTAREIYEQNDRNIGWSATSSQSRLNRIRANPTLLDFTAQTPVAASYGWFQVLYSTAIGGNWAGVGGHLNPSYLFDIPENLAAGGGSVRVAMVRLRGGFVAENGASATFATPDDFAVAWQSAFNNYNHNFGAEAARPYGIRVLQLSQSYLPVPSGAIFQ